MRFVAVVLGCLLVAACQTTPSVNVNKAGNPGISYSGGDGSTKESAVIITGAGGSSDGVPAEYDWVEKNLPGAKVESSSLVPGSRIYDVFDVTLSSGQRRSVYFDITSFFGKR